VDRKVWLWNWSQPAKAANTGLLLVVLLTLGWAVALGLAVAQLLVKLASSYRVLRLATGRR
jgi:CDP-diacylglycerol--glycerol-3-phosphate 3-phosphatidyltransferase